MMSATNRKPVTGKENVKNVECIRRAKAAPDFSKLHKQWDEKLQKGKAVKKKPLTSVQPFHLSQIPNRTNIPSEDVNFKVDPKSKESILNCKGITENNRRATLATVGRSSIKSGIPRPSKPPRLTDVSKCIVSTDVIKPEVSTDIAKPAADIKRSLFPEISPHVKKTNPKQDFKVHFECDKSSLDSIINGEGIPFLSTTPSNLSTKFGPTRRSFTKGRVVPFRKPAANSRLSERSRVIPGNLEDADAAKKRWSIYNRESFSTKVDLMTWLKQLAGQPNTQSDPSQSKISGLPVNSIAQASYVSCVANATNSVTEKAPIVCSSSTSTSSLSLSTSTKHSILKPSINFNMKQDFISNSQCSSQTKHCDIPSNMVFPDEPKSFKFNKTVVGYQGFKEVVDEESKSANGSMTCSTFISPDNFVRSKKVKSPVTKSILKKSNLSSIKEFSSSETRFDESRMQSISETKVMTPVRSNRSTPITNARTPTRSACKNTPTRSMKATRGTVKQNSTTLPTRSPTCAQNQLVCELSLPEQTHLIIGESINTPEIEIKDGTNVSEKMDTLNSVPSSHTPSFVKKLHEDSNIKKVRWHSELTYLSPVDGIREMQEERDLSTLNHTCAVQLFSDEALINHANSSETVNTMASNCEGSQNLLTTTDSSFLPSDDMKANKGSSFMSLGNRLTNNVTTAQSIIVSKAISPVSCNNVLLSKSTTSESVLPTKSAMSHQIKYVIPAEQPLEKSYVVNGAKGSLKSTAHSFVRGEVDSGISSPNTSSQCWADILGNKSYVNNANTVNSFVCVSGDGHSMTQPVMMDNNSCSTSQMNKSPNKKDKSKKKKRISILERIYGDAITYCDDSPENSSTTKDPGNNLCFGCGEMLYSNSSKNFSGDIPSCNNRQHSVGNKDIYNPLQSTLPKYQSTILHSPVHSNDDNQLFIGSTPILQNTVTKLRNNILSSPLSTENNVNELCSQFSSLQNMLSTTMGTFPQHNPSTFVTYSRNTSNILYGDLTEVSVSKPANMLPSSISLMTFSDEKKNAVLDGVELSPLVDNNCSKNTEYLGGVSVTTPFGKKECADYNAFIISPRVAKNDTQNSLQEERLSSLIASPVTSNEEASIYPTDVVVLSPLPGQSEKTVVARCLSSTPQSCLRSDKLDKYVSSLLGFPASSSGSRNILASKKLGIMDMPPYNEKSNTISTNTTNLSSHIILSPDICLDNTNNSSDCCSLLDESDICMVFSTPFKQGLRNHILHTNSFSNNNVRKDIPSETTNCITFSPSRNLHALCNGDTSAFRRIPPTCNIFPKFITPITPTNKSDEMEALFGIVSPTLSPVQYMRVEDAEISLYHQLGEISSRFHKEVNILRRGVNNPLSIILTTGDEMHFVPIDGGTKITS